MKACVRRQKNDAADAAAICEAVTRPTMRLVAIKSAELWIGVQLWLWRSFGDVEKLPTLVS